METIREYKIVSGYWVKPKLMRQPTLEEEVAKALAEGWKIVGGAFTIQALNGDQHGIPMLGQAMAR